MNSPFRKSKTVIMITLIGSSTFFLWLAMRGILDDPEAIGNLKRVFEKADYGNLPLILVILFTFYWLKAVRWSLLLAPLADFRPLRDLLSPILIGFAFNNILPARLGEFMRCFVFSKRNKVSVVSSISSVAMERVFDVISILFYLETGLLFTDFPDEIKLATYFLSAVTVFLIVCGVAYVYWTNSFIRFTENSLKRFSFLSEELVSKICQLLKSGGKGLESLKSIRLISAILIVSFIKWALHGCIIILALDSFGVQIPFTVAMVIMATVAIGVSIPSAPGYFGVVQACFVGALTVYDRQLDQPTIFAASVFFHMSLYVPVTISGLSLFLWSGLSFSQVANAEENCEIPQ